MSKFVTYPAVTVLDNDHSLLIDDPNAGTNSITAENAGNTLLSKWAGFETFDEAVQNTIEHNQEFIDRDTAIREETAELKKKIVTTFPAKEASGAVATFESEFEDAPLKSCIVQVNPVQDLHGYDHPWPAGGGKNLFQTTAVTTTVNGVTFTVNSDGSIKTTGTPTANISTFNFGRQTLPSGEYIANGFANGANSGTRMTVFNENTGAVLAIIYNGNDVTFTLTEESVVRVYPIILTDSYESGWTFYPMIRKSTEADATFAPYSNECPISGFTGCEVQRTGKNLLEIFGKNRTAILSKNTFVKAGTYAVSASGISGNYATYVRKATTEGSISGDIIANKVNQGNITFTLEEDTNLMVQWYAPNDSSADLTGKTFQLELGSTATAYEPYQGNTYPITFPSSAGTVYGGTLDVTTGELTVDRYYGTINNKQVNISTNSKGYFWYTTLYSLSYPSIKSDNAKLIANRLRMIVNTKETDPDGVMSVYGNGIIRWKEKGELTLDEYKTYLTENPLYFCYEVKSPIHILIPFTEIKTLLGTNNIWANTGDVSVEYLMSDVGWYVEKKLRAFQSILAGVEDSAVASKNYSTDSYLIFNNDIYRVTKTITAGETIEDGVNVTKTTVAEQLMALAQV